MIQFELNNIELPFQLVFFFSWWARWECGLCKSKAKCKHFHGLRIHVQTSQCGCGSTICEF